MTTWKKIAFEDDVILKTLMDADTVLTATTDNTPVATSMAAQTVLGRLTGGHPDDISIGIADDNILQVDDASAADNDYAKFTAAGLEGRTYAEALADLFSVTLPENTSIQLDAALSADGKYSGITEDGTAGTALVFGNLCYYQTEDSRWELTDADSATPAVIDGTIGGKLGICVLAAAADGSATRMLLWGKVNAASLYPALTIGARVYAGETAGNIQVTAPSNGADEDKAIRCVGVANSADEIFFHPAANRTFIVDNTSGGTNGNIADPPSSNALYDTMTAHNALATAHAAQKLNNHAAADGAVDFNGQIATELVLHTCANSGARPTGVVGLPVFQSDELAVYVCTVA